MSFYNHYLKLKEQHKDEIVFYRLGDFYECFGADAEKASKLLDLILTKRDVGGERVPMCGVPHHCVENYVKILIDKGCKVALCEPTEQSSETEKNPPQTQGRLHLTANGTEQTVLKEYLEANASETLVEKINNGVKIQKDGKTLVSKKTLETFLKYACDEAQKLAEKGARATCVKSDTVFNWAIHYFEEDSIEGTLFNEDGTEYKPVKAVAKPKTTAPVVAPKPQPKPQMSLFEMLDSEPKTTAEQQGEIEKLKLNLAKLTSKTIANVASYTKTVCGR